LSVLNQNPHATVSEVLEEVPEDLITRRESLRIRALIGTVSISLLAQYDSTGLAVALASEPDGKLADPDVVCGFTMPMSPKRIPVIAELFLNYLHNGLSAVETPAAESPKPRAPHVFVAPPPTPPQKPRPKKRVRSGPRKRVMRGQRRPQQ